MGTEGISIASLTFSVPASAVVRDTSMVPASPVVVSIVNNDTGGEYRLPTFYVDKRSIKKGICTFTCYDRLAFADSLTYTPEDFAPEGGGETPVNIGAMELVQKACDKLSITNNCAFDSLGNFNVDSVIGQTVGQVLSDISALYMGVFFIDNVGSLQFTVFNSGFNALDGEPYGGHFNDCTSPDIGDDIVIGCINVTDGEGKAYSVEADSGTAVLNVNTRAVFTDAKEVENYYKRLLQGKKYTYMNVDRVMLDGVPALDAVCTFADVNAAFAVNSIRCTVNSDGFYGAVGCNDYSVGEIGAYMGAITRQLNKTLKTGDRYGPDKHALHTAYQGTIWLDSSDYGG